MKSSPYREIFEQLIDEDSFAGDAGVFGDTSPVYSQNNIFSKNSYAPNDNRNIFGEPGKKSKFPVDSRNKRINNSVGVKKKKTVKRRKYRQSRQSRN